MIDKNDNKKSKSDNIHNDILDKNDLEKKIKILNEFLDEKTISFILNNNRNFIDKITNKSLLKSAKFYNAMNDHDYASVIKWYPIMLDYDRFSIILSYFKAKGLSNEQIVKKLGKDVIKDFELADILYDNKYNSISNDSLKGLNNMNVFAIKSKVKNETFNNLLKNNIKKYEKLLRKLK